MDQCVCFSLSHWFELWGEPKLLMPILSFRIDVTPGRFVFLISTLPLAFFFIAPCLNLSASPFYRTEGSYIVCNPKVFPLFIPSPVLSPCLFSNEGRNLQVDEEGKSIPFRVSPSSCQSSWCAIRFLLREVEVWGVEWSWSDRVM